MRVLDWHNTLVGVPAEMRAWLLDRGSLTQRISCRCADFAVQEVCQRDARPLLDEAAMAGVAGQQRALLRDVFLYCGTTPVVFAHSVLPYPSLSGRWTNLSRLGNRPLGAALFSDPLVRRECLQFRKIDWRHPLYRQAGIIMTHPPSYMWARRSLFALSARRILVTEIFLPSILTL